MKTRFVALLFLIGWLLFGCAARSGFDYAHAPKLGSPPIYEQGRWKCMNTHYRYNDFTKQCELEKP